MKYCALCGAPLGDGDRFCSVCGEAVTPDPVPANAGPKLELPDPVPPSVSMPEPGAPELKLPDPVTPDPVQTGPVSAPEPSAVPDFSQAEPQYQKEVPPPQPPQGGAVLPQPPRPSYEAAGNNGTQWLVRIFAVFFGAILLIRALFQVFGGLGNLLSLFSYRVNLLFVLYGVLQVATGACYLLMTVILLLFMLRNRRIHTDSLFAGVCGAGVLAAVINAVRLVLSLLLMLLGYRFLPGDFILEILGCAVVVLGMYGTLRLDGETPLAGKTMNQISGDLQGLQTAASDIMGDFSARRQNASAPQQPSRPTPPPRNDVPPQGSTVPPREESARQTVPPASPGTQAYYNGSQGAPVYGGNGRMLKTDRNVIIYLLLTIVTCGIYSLFFFYHMIQDINTACEGDGQRTPGLLAFILLGIITCGIYDIYWYYKVANRLQQNAPRYNMFFTENGTSVLLWMLIGWLLCGIGPLVGLHIIMKNTNALCIAYNRRFM